MLFPHLLDPCPKVPFPNTPPYQSNGRCCFRPVSGLRCAGAGGNGTLLVVFFGTAAEAVLLQQRARGGGHGGLWDGHRQAQRPLRHPLHHRQQFGTAAEAVLLRCRCLDPSWSIPSLAGPHRRSHSGLHRGTHGGRRGAPVPIKARPTAAANAIARARALGANRAARRWRPRCLALARGGGGGRPLQCWQGDARGRRTPRALLPQQVWLPPCWRMSMRYPTTYR